MNINEWLPFDPDKFSMESVFVPEVLIWMVGIVFLLAGARLYRLILMAPGFALGALIAVEYGGGFSREVQLMVTLGIGVIGALILSTLEKLAIAITDR